MPLDFADIKGTIQARMAALWTETPSGSIAFDNSGFVPPLDASPWVSLSVAELRSQDPLSWTAPETAAARLNGRIFIVAYVPLGEGDARLEQLLTAAKSLFEGQSFASAAAMIRVQASSSSANGPEAPWFKKIIALPFWAVPL